MSQTIDQILNKHESGKTGSAVGEDHLYEQGKYYASLRAEGLQEYFLELRFRDGICTCFPYHSLVFFNYDPEGAVIDAEFGGFLVSIRGRGLGGHLFRQLKSKRVAWIREADSDLEDGQEAEIYVSEITITPPDGFSSEEEEGTQKQS